MNISAKIKQILNIAAYTPAVEDIANKMGVSLAVVKGSLATIKKNDLGTYEDGKINLTKEGLKHAPIPANQQLMIVGEVKMEVKATPKKKLSKKEIVAQIILANPGKSKADVVPLIKAALDVSTQNARVYYYNWELATGRRTK